MLTLYELKTTRRALFIVLSSYQKSHCWGKTSFLSMLQALSSGIAAIIVFLAKINCSSTVYNRQILDFDYVQRCENRKTQAWNLDIEIWNLDIEIWNLDLEIWNLELGIWSLELGIWNLELGIWSLELGIWSLGLEA
jgi:hypothetical protein